MSSQNLLNDSSVRERVITPARRILLADDDVDMRTLLATVLRHDGHDVTECEDGTALLEVLAEGDTQPPDLVVSDVQMPRSTGLRVLARLRRLHPDMPVVLITAFGSPELHREAQRLGATFVLDKPFAVGTLRELVRRLVETPPAPAEAQS